MNRTTIRLLLGGLLALGTVACDGDATQDPTPGPVPEVNEDAGPVPDETGTPAPIVS